MAHHRLVFTFALVAAFPVARAQTASPSPAAPVGAAPKPASPAEDTPPVRDPKLDVLQFKDGDVLSGTLVRIEKGEAVFRSSKTGKIEVDFDHIRDLLCKRTFAVIPKGVRINHQNAFLGTIELRDGKLIVTPPAGAPRAYTAEDVALAVDDQTFEHELKRQVPFTEGWSLSASVGASIVRSTDNATAFTTSLSLARERPGIDYLPRRNSSSFSINDSYELVDNKATEDTPASNSEAHILHAEAEQNQYFHSPVYLLIDYSFDHNYAQGLQAGNLIGGGLGWTAIKSSRQELEIKTDLHYESQIFKDISNNDNLFGQKLVVAYERSLPGNLRFEEDADYLPSYTEPHKFSADSTSVLTIPLIWSLRLALTATDNYLNNVDPGDQRNTFRFATSINFSR